MKKVKLGDICSILNGYAFKSDKYVNHGIRIIRIANVQKGFIEDVDPQFYPKSEMSEIKRYMLEEGDILMSLTGNVGRVALLQKSMLPAALNQRVACLRIKDIEEVFKPYIFHYLDADSFENKCVFSSKGVAQKNMSTEWLKEVQIPLPSIEEQKAVADRLDKISDMIAKRKEQLAKLDQLVKSRFIEMFGDCTSNTNNWAIVKLNDTCDVRDGTHDSPEYFSVGVPLITSKNISSGYLDFSNVSLISEKDAEQINKRSKVDKGDILLPMIGTVGGAVIIDIEPNFCIKNVALIKFTKSNINNIFVREYLNSDAVNAIFESVKNGGTQKFVGLGTIRSLPISIPPISLQNEFAEFVKRTDKSKFEIQQSIDKLETLKKSLMQQYFG